MMRNLFKFMTILIVGLLSLYTFIFIKQDYLIMQFEPTARDYRFEFPMQVDELYFEGNEHGNIHALYFQNPSPKGVVLYFHGRGENLAKRWAKQAEKIYQRGYDVLILDYRQFGKSKGALNQTLLLEDGTTAYRFLLSRYDESNIIVYGVSFGTGIATYIASQYHPKALVLEAPYFSMTDLIPVNGYPWIPKPIVKLLLKYPLPTNEWIVHVKSPIYLVHGKKDKIIPYECSTMLLKQLNNPNQATLISIEEGEHIGLFRHQEYSRFIHLAFP